VFNIFLFLIFLMACQKTATTTSQGSQFISEPFLTLNATDCLESVDGKVLLQLSAQSSVEIKSKQGEWYHIISQNQKCWVNEKNLQDVKAVEALHQKAWEKFKLDYKKNPQIKKIKSPEIFLRALDEATITQIFSKTKNEFDVYLYFDLSVNVTKGHINGQFKSWYLHFQKIDNEYVITKIVTD
jgi:hypothetical protein